MKFKFISPIGRTLESILIDAKKMLRGYGRALPRKGSPNARFPTEDFVERLGRGLSRNDEGQWSSPESTKAYVQEFLRLNHYR